jgi:hypothetical protein
MKNRWRNKRARDARIKRSIAAITTQLSGPQAKDVYDLQMMKLLELQKALNKEHKHG